MDNYTQTACTVLVHFSRVFLCHPQHAYGSFLAENVQELILVFLKNENLDLHDLNCVLFTVFFNKI